MTVAIYLPLAMSVLLAAGAPLLARRLAPAAGSIALAWVAVIVAASSAWSLSLLVVSLVDDLPGGPPIPVPDWVSFVAMAALVWCWVRIRRARTDRRRLQVQLDAVVADRDTELVVVRDPRPHAFAVAGEDGRPGRIVVTAAMLEALTAPQRRAMLAHERAHLECRHPALLTMAYFATAANPLLSPVGSAVAYLCERHADEVAAAEVGDRIVVAEALAAAALAGSGAAGPPAFHRLGVVSRVTALVCPPRRPRWAGLLTATGIAVIALVAAADATDQFYLLVRAGLPSLP